jgi:glycerol-3-phosphate dehydrogenase (NAD(P)+)
MIAVVGAGAMGAALSVHLHRAGRPAVVLGTVFDARTVDACRAGRPHPALGIVLPAGLDCHTHDDWPKILPDAELVLFAVSSEGFASTVDEVAALAAPDALWASAAKGWDEITLRGPSETVADSLGGAEALVVLAGPTLAPELAVGAPTGLVCAARNLDAAHRVAAMLRAGDVTTSVTDDVAGVETAAAYKNVVAVAVGMCEGLSEHLNENTFVHAFANARAAVFGLGLRDMARLSRARGGRPETILDLAGGGDLYVTCLGGRNGTMGRLLGLGETTAQAEATIGSTVEGIASTNVSLKLAERLGVDLPTARAVQSVVTGRTAARDAIQQLLHTRFDVS